jgi:hypothetical protein
MGTGRDRSHLEARFVVTARLYAAQPGITRLREFHLAAISARRPSACFSANCNPSKFQATVSHALNTHKVMGNLRPAKVLIIGAGPVGLTQAIEFTRFGTPVRIVEKAAQRTDKSKALVLWSRTLELLDRQPGSSTASWRPASRSGLSVSSPATS